MILLLIFVSEVRFEMQLGHSFCHCLQKKLSHYRQPYFKELKIWLEKLLAGQNPQKVSAKFTKLTQNAQKRSFLTIIEKAIQGSPIDIYLQDFEQELLLAVENELERSIQLLPLKLLVPLTLFILPAVVLLFLAPLLSTLGGL